jgi:hypothetical protein
MGGFIAPYWAKGQLTATWTVVKKVLTGNPDSELKWSHFFRGRHQSAHDNPLQSEDPDEWREQAKWALQQLLGLSFVLPVNTRIRKDRASESAFKSLGADSAASYRVLDTEVLWIPVLAQYALFLSKIGSVGEIWFDRMGSRAEERRRQQSWIELREGDWKVNPENQTLFKSISPEIRFFDSRRNALVQVADFISGVIWAASEGDDDFLLGVIEKYFPTGVPSFTLVQVGLNKPTITLPGPCPDKSNEKV